LKYQTDRRSAWRIPYYEQAGRNLLPFRTNFQAALNFKSNSESGKQKCEKKSRRRARMGEFPADARGFGGGLKLEKFNNIDRAAATHPCRRLRR